MHRIHSTIFFIKRTILYLLEIRRGRPAGMIDHGHALAPFRNVQLVFYVKDFEMIGACFGGVREGE